MGDRKVAVTFGTGPTTLMVEGLRGLAANGGRIEGGFGDPETEQSIRAAHNNQKDYVIDLREGGADV